MASMTHWRNRSLIGREARPEWPLRRGAAVIGLVSLTIWVGIGYAIL